MKNLCFYLFLLIALPSCQNDDDDCMGVECLPPATQTGEGTFGCLVNGEPFVDNSGRFNCFYQLVNGEYRFNLSPNFRGKLLTELDIGCRNLDFKNIQSFDLASSDEGEGEATFLIGSELRDISTNQEFNGVCNLSYFDAEANIISGTFNFRIYDTISEILYTVTEGRFDAKFTE